MHRSDESSKLRIDAGFTPWAMSHHSMHTTCLAVLLSLAVTASAAELPEGVRRIKVLNYAECFELSNAETRVTLCHQVGGRVLEYSFKETNALYLDPEEAKWGTPGGPRAPSSAGRFDIGDLPRSKRQEIMSTAQVTLTDRN